MTNQINPNCDDPVEKVLFYAIILNRPSLFNKRTLEDGFEHLTFLQGICRKNAPNYVILDNVLHYVISHSS